MYLIKCFVSCSQHKSNCTRDGRTQVDLCCGNWTVTFSRWCEPATDDLEQIGVLWTGQSLSIWVMLSQQDENSTQYDGVYWLYFPGSTKVPDEAAVGSPKGHQWQEKPSISFSSDDPDEWHRPWPRDVVTPSMLWRFPYLINWLSFFFSFFFHTLVLVRILPTTPNVATWEANIFSPP